MTASVLNGRLRSLYAEEHEAFRDMVRRFLEREAVPNLESWEKERLVDRAFWRKAGEAGLLGLAVPEKYAGGGTDDYRFRSVIIEEVARINSGSVQSSLALQDDVFLPYIVELGTDEQKKRWLPSSCAGTTIGAIAMTEPDAGSDLQGIRTTAVRSGDYWVLNGAKTFITNGILSDLVIVVARTDPEAGTRGFSLLVVERDTPGFSRGRKLRKLGLHAQDTAELHFDDCRVPAGNLLGTEGRGFSYLMENLPLERLSIAVSGIAAARSALQWTCDYVKDRQAFGKRLIDQQSIQFALAEMLTEIDVGQAFIDTSIASYNAGNLTASDASKGKWWMTELQKRVVDQCVQLHGGYGYMEEYPIARAYLDTRVQTIYGGTTEIMKLIIGREIANA